MFLRGARTLSDDGFRSFLAFQRGGGEEEGQEGEEQNCCGKVSQQTEGADRHSAGCK